MQLILPDSETGAAIEPPTSSQAIIADLFQRAGADADANGVTCRPAVCADAKHIYVLVYNHTANTTAIAKVGTGHHDTIAGEVYHSTQVTTALPDNTCIKNNVSSSC